MFHNTLKDSILKLHNAVETDKSERNVLNDHDMLFYYNAKMKLNKRQNKHKNKDKVHQNREIKNRNSDAKSKNKNENKYKNSDVKNSSQKK